MSRQKLLTTQRGQTAWLRHIIPRDKIWRIVDGRDQVLGRVAGQIAKLLQGKHKVSYLDNMHCGDPVIVINARDIVLTGRKSRNKVYYHHTGYPGGLKKVPIRSVYEKRPEDVLRLAVRSMLPRNKLRALMLDDLKIFMGPDHHYESLKPVPVAPAHCGSRIGHGGPPTMEELEKWWGDSVMYEDEGSLQEIYNEVKNECGGKRVGLAQLLEMDSGEDRKQDEIEAHRKYVAAAEMQLQSDPVLIPNIL